MAIQSLILVLALFVGIIRPQPQPEPGFTAIPAPSTSSEQVARQESLQQIQRWSGGAAALERIISQSMLAEQFPALDIPSIPADMPSTLEHSDSLDILPLALSSGALDLSGVSSEASSLEFLGLQTAASRIVLALDVSMTVKRKVEAAGMSMERIRDEAITQLAQLNANTMFGIIQFARNHETFAPQLRTATRANRTEGKSWLESRLRIDGGAGQGWRRDHPNGIESVIRAAFRMDPFVDTIIIVSDGDFYYTPTGGGSRRVPWQRLEELTRSLQEQHAEPCSIHLVAFGLSPAHRTAAEEWLRPWGGRLKIMNSR